MLVFVNDGKERWQSFEAYSTFAKQIEELYLSDGYGEDEEDSKEQYLKNLTKYKEKVTELLDKAMEDAKNTKTEDMKRVDYDGKMYSY